MSYREREHLSFFFFFLRILFISMHFKHLYIQSFIRKNCVHLSYMCMIINKFNLVVWSSRFHFDARLPRLRFPVVFKWL